MTTLRSKPPVCPITYASSRASPRYPTSRPRQRHSPSASGSQTNHTLYVADEGDGYTGGVDLYSHAATQSTAGLQKWILNKMSGTWSMAYVLTQGLDLGKPYTVPHYPSGTNAATALPWSPATDGLRNITGRVGRDGVATIWGITSTVSGNGDVGADPNRLVVIRDVVDEASAAARNHERFVTLRTAGFAEALRGVAFAPGTEVYTDH